VISAGIGEVRVDPLDSSIDLPVGHNGYNSIGWRIKKAQ
jgi:hypothetical protein